MRAGPDCIARRGRVGCAGWGSRAGRAPGRRGPDPGPWRPRDAQAFAASGLAGPLAGTPAAADLGYVGVQGVEIVPFKRLPGGDLTTSQAEFNTALSKTRAAVEHAVAHLKTWRMLSEEGGRYRAPIEKYPSMLKAVIGLYFIAICE
jgi:DDE superfamily endonuclease